MPRIPAASKTGFLNFRPATSTSKQFKTALNHAFFSKSYSVLQIKLRNEAEKAMMETEN